MSFSFQPNLRDLSTYSKHSKWFLLWGLALVLLGFFAIGFATFTTLLSVLFLGFIILTSGFVILFDTFTFWRGKQQGFFLHLLMGILYLVAGGILVYNPIFAAASLTLLLGSFYLVLGMFRLFYCFSIRTPHRVWNFFNGFVAFLLGILILGQWPASSLFIIGLFVGIDLIFCGWSYLMIGMAARK